MGTAVDDTLWQWIELTDYETPSVPTTMLAQRWWQKTLQTLKPNRVDVSSSSSTESEPVQAEFEFAYDPLLGALDALLDTQRQNDVRITWLVLPPNSPAWNAVDEWTKRNSWQQLTVPQRDQLLTSQPVDEVHLPSEPWIMTDLSRGFIRHPLGMRWLQSFLKTTLHTADAPGLVVCGSWLYYYLEKTHGGLNRQALTLRPFDTDHLVTSELAVSRAHAKRLLAVSEGNPGVAAAYRNAFPVSADETEIVLEIPRVPTVHGEISTFVLYALLLHGGLSTFLLTEVLKSVAPNLIEHCLNLLRSHGIVSYQDDCWKVTELGYPAAKQFLAQRDFNWTPC
tara:strand:- start:7548 stop:8561 length:1014 start_codon:yes stop_codon:yes gene_type:complete